MRTPSDDHLPEHLAEVADGVRRHGPEITALQLDAIKRRALARAAASPRKGHRLRSKLVTLLLAGGLTITGGTAGVIAAGGPDIPGKSAAKTQYVKAKCNSGNGNGSEPLANTGHCTNGDPGNSFNAGNRGGDEIPTSGGVPNPGGNNTSGSGKGGKGGK